MAGETPNPVGTLAALLQDTSAYYGGNGVTAAPTSGGPPRAGVTANYQQSQAAAAEAEAEAAPPEVYLGTTTGTQAPGTSDTPRGYGSTNSTPHKVDQTASLPDLIAAFAKAPPAEQRRMAILLSIAGFTDDLKSMGSGASSLETMVKNGYEMSQIEVINAYQNLLKEAAIRYAVWDRKVTPEDVLREGVAFMLPTGTQWDGDFDTLPVALAEAGVEVPGLTAVAEGEGGEDDGKGKKALPFSGTKTVTSTSTVRDIMDPADAKALTRAMLQRELGRDPTEDEFDDFIGAIQYAQKVNPSKTTTTSSQTYEKGELVSQNSNSTTRQGIGADGVADIALQKARQNPNWAEWQAVGTYAPALFEALGATVAGR
jgi:hypothetical protein